MYVFIIGRNTDGNRLLLNGGLQIVFKRHLAMNSLDLDVGGLGGRVKAVARTLGSS